MQVLMSSSVVSLPSLPGFPAPSPEPVQLADNWVKTNDGCKDGQLIVTLTQYLWEKWISVWWEVLGTIFKQGKSSFLPHLTTSLVLCSLLCLGAILCAAPLLAKAISAGGSFTLLRGWVEESGCLVLVLTQKPWQMHFAKLAFPNF